MKVIKINAVWCGGCLVMHKVWKEIMKEYPNLDVIEYDYDMDEDEVKKYNVGDKLPVAIFYDGDKEVKRLVGEKKLTEIKEVLDEKDN